MFQKVPPLISICAFNIYQNAEQTKNYFILYSQKYGVCIKLVFSITEKAVYVSAK